MAGIGDVAEDWRWSKAVPLLKKGGTWELQNSQPDRVIAQGMQRKILEQIIKQSFFLKTP